MEAGTLQLVIQAGAVGIALVVIYFGHKERTEKDKLFTNSLKDLDKTLHNHYTEVTGAMSKFHSLLEDIHKDKINTREVLNTATKLNQKMLDIIEKK